MVFHKHKINIVIVGANSNVARILEFYFNKIDNVFLNLYTTNKNKIELFSNSYLCGNYEIFEGYSSGLIKNADILINCVGVGTPKQLGNDYTPWFTVLEQFDNMCIDYLKYNSNTTYINFSSGTVYGNDFSQAVDSKSSTSINVNKFGVDNLYSTCKIYSEAKHRAFANLKIIDLRLFSFFSRFSDLDDGYLMSDIANCIKNNIVLETDSFNIVRDYIHGSDLVNLILACYQKNLNIAFDVQSKQNVSKFQILEKFSKIFGLKYTIKDNLYFVNSSGKKENYYSTSKMVKNILGFVPKYTSLDALECELNALIISGNKY